MKSDSALRERYIVKLEGHKYMIEIKETTAEDIKNIQRLWADGDVMRFVGFAPNGRGNAGMALPNQLS